MRRDQEGTQPACTVNQDARLSQKRTKRDYKNCMAICHRGGVGVLISELLAATKMNWMMVNNDNQKVTACEILLSTVFFHLLIH